MIEIKFKNIFDFIVIKNIETKIWNLKYDKIVSLR